MLWRAYCLWIVSEALGIAAHKLVSMAVSVETFPARPPRLHMSTKS